MPMQMLLPSLAPPQQQQQLQNQSAVSPMIHTPAHSGAAGSNALLASASHHVSKGVHILHPLVVGKLLAAVDDLSAGLAESLAVLRATVAPGSALPPPRLHRIGVAQQADFLFALPADTWRADVASALRLAAGSMSGTLAFMLAAAFILHAPDAQLQVNQLKALFETLHTDILNMVRAASTSVRSPICDMLAVRIGSVERMSTQLLSRFDGEFKSSLELSTSVVNAAAVPSDANSMRSMALTVRRFITTKSAVPKDASLDFFLSVSSDILFYCDTFFRGYDRLCQSHATSVDLDGSRSGADLFEFAASEAVRSALDLAIIIANEVKHQTDKDAKSGRYDVSMSSAIAAVPMSRNNHSALPSATTAPAHRRRRSSFDSITDSLRSSFDEQILSPASGDQLHGQASDVEKKWKTALQDLLISAKSKQAQGEGSTSLSVQFRSSLRLRVRNLNMVLNTLFVNLTSTDVSREALGIRRQDVVNSSGIVTAFSNLGSFGRAGAIESGRRPSFISRARSAASKRDLSLLKAEGQVSTKVPDIEADELVAAAGALLEDARTIKTEGGRHLLVAEISNDEFVASVAAGRPSLSHDSGHELQINGITNWMESLDDHCNDLLDSLASVVGPRAIVGIRSLVKTRNHGSSPAQVLYMVSQSDLAPFPPSRRSRIAACFLVAAATAKLLRALHAFMLAADTAAAETASMFDRRDRPETVMDREYSFESEADTSGERSLESLSPTPPAALVDPSTA
ncbi:hypothetical protein HK405_004240, partial [Cladochytrium tenue]